MQIKLCYYYLIKRKKLNYTKDMIVVETESVEFIIFNITETT
jgi:hypothetical protein